MSSEARSSHPPFADPDAATIRIFGTDNPMHEPTEGVLLQLFGGDPDDVLDEYQIAIDLANILEAEGQTEFELDRKNNWTSWGADAAGIEVVLTTIVPFISTTGSALLNAYLIDRLIKNRKTMSAEPEPEDLEVWCRTNIQRLFKLDWERAGNIELKETIVDGETITLHFSDSEQGWEYIVPTDSKQRSNQAPLRISRRHTSGEPVKKHF